MEHVRLPPLSSGGALVAQPWLRFHTPLIEPDRQISCIRLSDKTSRLGPRHGVPKPAQTYEPEVPVEVREWIAPAPPDFVLEAQPPAQPRRRVGIERSIRLADGAYRKVVRPSECEGEEPQGIRTSEPVVLRPSRSACAVAALANG